MRNPGLARCWRAAMPPHLPEVRLGILLYALLTVLISLPVLRWQQWLGSER